MVWITIRDALLLVALVPFAYFLFAILAAREFFAQASATPPDAALPPISILRPIYGLDREAYENYASFCRQEYPEFEMLCCVADETDSAIPVIQKLIADFPERSIRLLIGSQPLGASDKVNKLCRMAKEARHDLLIVSDSDVRVEPGFLRSVALPFSDPAIGGVTCLYRGLTDGSFAANLEALGNSTDFAPGVIVARRLSGIDFMLGAVMATTKARLTGIGGFEALVNHFADDYELGNRIARHGHRVELSRFPVSIVYPRETLRQAFRHQTRWYASIKISRRWAHFGLIFTHALPWTILAAALSPGFWIALAYAGAYLVLRFWLAWSVGVSGMRDDLVRRKFWMLPLRDAFAFAAWLASFLPRRIHWRGQQFYVRNRRLVPASPAAPDHAAPR
jgi:ceramide glucosyltransferase